MALSNADETDIKVAILYAMGVRVEEIAARLDRKADTLYKRRAREYDRLYSWVEKLVESELERNVAARVTKIQEHADLKAQIQKQSYRGLKKLVDRVDDEGPPDVLLLGAVKEGLDRTEGKALDRKAILSRNENVNRTEISIDDLAEFMDEVRRLSAPREPQPLLAAVPEADLVGPSN